MDNLVKIKIDGKDFELASNLSILDVSKNLNLDIPYLCDHPDLDVRANCRMCMVEIKGKLVPACSTKISEGMEIITQSERIHKTRKSNLELIMANHQQDCFHCPYFGSCQLKNLMKTYGLNASAFSSRKKNREDFSMGKSVVFKSQKCMECRACVSACEKQGINFLEIDGNGLEIKIIPSLNKNKDCVYCGQCVSHCPVGAMLPDMSDLEEIEKLLKEKKYILIAQIAPAIRASLGEEFKIPYGQLTVGHISTGLKALGFQYVFDVSTGADLTTMEEAQELIERIEHNGKLPLLTSCCPAWVKYVEFYRPEFINNLTTVRSPQMIMSNVIKSYWAKENKIKSANIKLVSIMPCTAKKYEANRPEFKKLVDYVLTTRELALLLKRHQVMPEKLKESSLDALFSSSGVIYGASGGVMESALRTAYYLITGKEPQEIAFEKMRGLEGCRQAKYKIGKYTLNVAAVSGLKNAENLLQKIKADSKLYDYVEIMACPGGCLSGGGQPVPVNDEIRKKRANVLYQLDKKSEIKYAHDNPFVKEIYKTFLKDEKNRKTVCHTQYAKKKKEGHIIKKI
ncbi:MAG: [FeFe] hydrogenase, group A [Candidatus Parcubacteria bacterium]|nr:[FeFe] hydrogenase, group A [Candidatus Parcubacteria bacterium]